MKFQSPLKLLRVNVSTQVPQYLLDEGVSIPFEASAGQCLKGAGEAGGQWKLFQSPLKLLRVNVDD